MNTTTIEADAKKRAKGREAARKQARERRLALDRERDARDARIEEATTVAILAIEARGDAEDARVAAIAHADAVIAAAAAQVGTALIDIKSEDVTAERVATLVDLPLTEVNKLIKEATKLARPAPVEVPLASEASASARRSAATCA